MRPTVILAKQAVLGAGFAALLAVGSVAEAQVVTCFQAPREGIISLPQNLTAFAMETVKA